MKLMIFLLAATSGAGAEFTIPVYAETSTSVTPVVHIAARTRTRPPSP